MREIHVLVGGTNKCGTNLCQNGGTGTVSYCTVYQAYHNTVRFSAEPLEIGTC